MSVERTRERIVELVQKRAGAEMAKLPELTPEAARARVWESDPQLYSEYVTARSQQPSIEFEKTAPVRTLADEILEVVQKRADQALWTRWPHASREDLVFETFQAHPEVYELYRSPQAKLPVAGAKRRVDKSVEHKEAFLLLSAWASE